MSVDSSTKSSTSGSSSDSANQALIMRSDITREIGDLTLFGSPAPMVLSRTGTVVRRVAVTTTPALTTNNINDASSSIHSAFNPTTRKSLDSCNSSFFRRSLDSLPEYKTRRTFSASTVYPLSGGSNCSASSTDCSTDFALMRSISNGVDDQDERTSPNDSSNYFSWIESVENGVADDDNFRDAVHNVNNNNDVMDVDSKVGEWNNFWLNYNSPRNRYFMSTNSPPHLCGSNEDVNNKTADEFSDAKSTTSTQREFTDKNSFEQIVLSLDEVSETIKCSQRIIEILQSAIKRSNDCGEESKIESCSSSQHFLQSAANSTGKLVMVPNKERRSYSYVLDPQELQRQRQLLKPAAQSSSTSCINALLNTGVADILKRVITKRRDVVAPPEDLPSASRSSFSEWSTK